MPQTTKIEWADASWNPVTGCTKVSAGCKNCYALTDAFRFGDLRPFYKGVTEQRRGKVLFTGRMNRQDSQFYKPRDTNKPHIYFLNSMSDFFHADADDAWRLEAIKITDECDRHLFLIITKRTDEMIRFFERNPTAKLSDNVWLGATVESEKYTHRIDELISVPAKIHFLMLEPLLGPIPNLKLTNIDWVIVGGESEQSLAKRRDMEHSWVDDILQQSEAANVPFFFKQ